MILSCRSSVPIPVVEKYCEPGTKNEFERIVADQYTYVTNNDTVFINFTKFKGADPFHISKLMYDKFGKWDEARYQEGERHPFLVWKSVPLFEDNPTRYFVVTSGEESRKSTNAAIMVFDQKMNDLLAKDSPQKDKINARIAKFICETGWEDRSFYRVYWKDVDPDFYQSYYLGSK